MNVSKSKNFQGQETRGCAHAVFVCSWELKIKRLSFMPDRERPQIGII
jgi:hypothetical protein